LQRFNRAEDLLRHVEALKQIANVEKEAARARLEAEQKSVDQNTKVISGWTGWW